MYLIYLNHLSGEGNTGFKCKLAILNLLIYYVFRELSVEERDARTVFCMQLSSRIRSRDLEDFFSVVGKVNDVRIITDTKTRRSKGIAYVEFCDVESVPLVSFLCTEQVNIIIVSCDKQ